MPESKVLVTAIIPTFNEEENIKNALESVLWADEIIVVDSFSNDATLDIVREYPQVTLVQHEYVNSATQKNWIIPQAKHSWIFLLDADEIASPSLIDEVQSLLHSGLDKDAYWIKRKTKFMGKEIKYGGWRDDKVIRLFSRDKCRYEEKRVHAEIMAEGEIGMLKHLIIHNTWRGIDHLLSKINWYSTWKAYDKVDHGKPVGFFLTVILKPVWRFVHDYFLRLGFLDGQVGFHIAIISAYDVYLRGLKIQLIKKGEKIRRDKQ